jgi:hypothetical protein
MTSPSLVWFAIVGAQAGVDIGIPVLPSSASPSRKWRMSIPSI